MLTQSSKLFATSLLVRSTIFNEQYCQLFSTINNANCKTPKEQKFVDKKFGNYQSKNLEKDFSEAAIKDMHERSGESFDILMSGLEILKKREIFGLYYLTATAEKRNNNNPGFVYLLKIDCIADGPYYSLGSTNGMTICFPTNCNLILMCYSINHVEAEKNLKNIFLSTFGPNHNTGDRCYKGCEYEMKQLIVRIK